MTGLVMMVSAVIGIWGRERTRRGVMVAGIGIPNV
jgi:hypothetical protein